MTVSIARRQVEPASPGAPLRPADERWGVELV